MADKKISALTSATTPLAGTEVLPIVQTGATVKVTTDDLTVKNIRANATTGILQVTGPAAASTRVVTVPDANFTAARTDAAQSFTGDQTLSTGNLIQGTAAKGLNFTANSPLGGMTSRLLNWYEEGTWTPTFSALTVVGTPTYTGKYTRIGRQVTIVLRIQSTTSTASTLGLTYFNLPIAATSTSTLTAVQSLAGASYGVGLIYTDGNCYPPTWAANADVTISGTFLV
jgi:hypothetical protein